MHSVSRWEANRIQITETYKFYAFKYREWLFSLNLCISFNRNSYKLRFQLYFHTLSDFNPLLPTFPKMCRNLSIYICTSSLKYKSPNIRWTIILCRNKWLWELSKQKYWRLAFMSSKQHAQMDINAKTNGYTIVPITQHKYKCTTLIPIQPGLSLTEYDHSG